MRPAIETRVAKVIIVGTLALFALVVTFDKFGRLQREFRIRSPRPQYDTTSPGNVLLYRRVTSPALWTAAYGLIVCAEGLTAVTLAVGAIVMVRDLRSDGARFNRSKRIVVIGATLGFLVWFFGLMVIGGEWFQMWQSQSWNGQQAAFRFYMTILTILIFVTQRDDDLEIQPDEHSEEAPRSYG